MATLPTVFVVDDDEPVRDSLTALLESAGLAVETYRSAHDFLELYDPQRPGCLLLDVRMPGLSGTELHEQLNRRGIRLPVIIVTGFGDIPMAVAAIKAGAVDFIEKPYSDEAILESVRRGLARADRDNSTELKAAAILERLRLLTPRERQVLEQLVIGDSNKQVASKLGISPRTVEIHRARIMEKMQARSLSHLVRMALSAGLDPQAS